ncbi:MAG: hypothetical protein V3U93_00800 [Alphaproteobacteria bacterium]
MRNKATQSNPPRFEGFRSIGALAAEIVADLRFRRQVERVHALGPRATAELLAEIGAERAIMTVIDKKLDNYVELDPKVLEAVGGDRFWPVPIRKVER